MKDIKLNIVNVTELKPGHKYLMELPHEAYSYEDAHKLAELLKGSAIITVKRGDEEIKIKDVGKKDA